VERFRDLFAWAWMLVFVITMICAPIYIVFLLVRQIAMHPGDSIWAIILIVGIGYLMFLLAQFILFGFPGEDK